MTNECRRQLNFLAGGGPLANTMLKNRDADEIMLQTGGTLIASGILYNIVCKKLSPGVCCLSLKRAN